MNRPAGWLGAALAALVVMLAHKWITAGLLLAGLTLVAGWVTWESLARAERASDDRADLVPHEPRRLPRIPEKVKHARIPPVPRLPRVRRLPPEVMMPPGAEVVPGSIQRWLRPPGKDKTI